MKSKPHKPQIDDNVLERNVGTLIEAGGEAPRLSDGARARIRAQLIEKHGKEASRKRSPLIAVGLGLAATAAGALVVTRIGSHPETVAEDGGNKTDGATWLVPDDSSKVTKLGDRRLRVEGAALIDVEPGKGAFTVETARGTIEVVGTRFLVDADKDRTTTAVLRGAVKLAAAGSGDGGDVLLHAGEQGVVEQGRPPTRMPAPRLSHLASWVEQARKKDQHAVKPIRNGTLFAREPNNPWVPETPLPIVKLGVDVVVEDQVARVAIDQTFHNPNNRVMEGMYKFAIPPDASLQRLAMYVDGKLTESAVVERMAARRIYEDVVYRRLDPALLEWAGTGRLSLKVYPLPADQDKRLLIAYTQSVQKLYDDYTLTVPLPEVDLPVGDLSFDVRMKGCANCEVTSTSHKIDVKRTGNDAIVTYHKGHVELGDSLVLHVRDTRKTPIVALDRDADSSYVMVRARPDLTAAARAYRKRTWVILDDVSASRDAITRRAQHDMIDGFLRELDEDDKVAIVSFDVTARTKLAPTRVLDVDRKAVRAALSEEGDVGATDFGVALDTAIKLLAGVDADDANIVYLGDGIISSGPRQLDKLRDKLRGKAHFVGVGIGDGPDTQTLDSLAAATGGYATTIDLADDVGWRAFDLVAALHTSRVAGLEGKLVDSSGALVPATVYLKTPQLADGEELELVARITGAGTPVAAELTGTLNGKQWTQRVALDTTTTEAGYLPRLWAQRHIAARLLAKHEPVNVAPCVAEPVVAQPQRVTRGPAQPAKPPACQTEAEAREERDEGIRKEVVALGKQYFLLSRHTSLLVLENDEMYKKYGVTKGSGDTWAPYKVPDKIEVVTRPQVTPDVASDAELVRRPIQIFYNGGYYDPTVALQLEGSTLDGWRTFQSSRTTALGYLGTRGELGLIGGGGTGSGYGVGGGGRGRGPMAEAKPDSNMALDEGKMGLKDLDRREVRKVLRDEEAQSAAPVDADDKAVEKERTVVFADELGGVGGEDLIPRRTRGNFGAVGKATKASIDFQSRSIIPQRLQYPTDITFDDLTAFIPALVRDVTDSWRQELTASAGAAKTHPIDDAAKALLQAARDAMPTGMYRWGDLEIAVDAQHRIGWKRTTSTDLAETASFDGKTLTRRYAELGIDVTRTFAEDDVALALGYLPLWIAEPSHYARWFEVRARGTNEVALSRTVLRNGKPATELAYVLVFDGTHHLTAIRDAKNTELLSVTWGAAGPTAAKLGGDDVHLGFSGLPITDVASWAHGSAQADVAIEMPMRLPAYWETKAGKLAEGSAEWRYALRQRMASLAAVNDRTNLFKVYDALRTHGGALLGDLALASGGVAGGTTDVQFRAAIGKLETQPIAQYLTAARAYAQTQKYERMKAATQTGFVGALWTLREITALYAADKDSLAIERLLSLGDRASELRLAAVGATQNRYRMSATDIARAWDSIAKGVYKNVARAQSAMLLANRGQYDAAAERIAKLVDDLDLAAAPPQLASMQYYFNSSRRGQAGWQLVYATLRDKVMAGGSYEHLVALLPLAQQHPIDTPAILARAVKLAGDDDDKVIAVARLASSYGQAAYGNSLLEPMVKKHPTRELHQLVGALALNQGRYADALAHYEAAQALADPDEQVALTTLRGELAQIISIARQLAVQAQGADRQAAVKRALDWGRKWKAIDPGNLQIDSQLGDLLLAVGDTQEAWRYLSSVIERDPMSGDGYAMVAQAFETQGKVAEAVAYWHQAVIIDQTNPTHRMREAQALIALGKTDEGDKILADIASRKWHARWDGVVYQVKNLIERAKHPNGSGSLIDE